MGIATLVREHEDLLVAAATDTLADTEVEMLDELREGTLGGTVLAIEASICHHQTEERIDLLKEFLDSGMPDPEGGKYDYRGIAALKQDSSAVYGKTVREMLELGLPTRTKYHGNVVINLGDGFFLVVSCSGLDEDSDGHMAMLYAVRLMFRIRRLVRMWATD